MEEKKEKPFALETGLQDLSSRLSVLVDRCKFRISVLKSQLQSTFDSSLEEEPSITSVPGDDLEEAIHSIDRICNQKTKKEEKRYQALCRINKNLRNFYGKFNEEKQRERTQYTEIMNNVGGLIQSVNYLEKEMEDYRTSRQSPRTKQKGLLLSVTPKAEARSSLSKIYSANPTKSVHRNTKSTREIPYELDRTEHPKQLAKRIAHISDKIMEKNSYNESPHLYLELTNHVKNLLKSINSPDCAQKTSSSQNPFLRKSEKSASKLLQRNKGQSLKFDKPGKESLKNLVDFTESKFKQICSKVSEFEKKFKEKLPDFELKMKQIMANKKVVCDELKSKSKLKNLVIQELEEQLKYSSDTNNQTQSLLNVSLKTQKELRIIVNTLHTEISELGESNKILNRQLEETQDRFKSEIGHKKTRIRGLKKELQQFYSKDTLPKSSRAEFEDIDEPSTIEKLTKSSFSIHDIPMHDSHLTDSYDNSRFSLESTSENLKHELLAKEETIKQMTAELSILHSQFKQINSLIDNNIDISSVGNHLAILIDSKDSEISDLRKSIDYQDENYINQKEKYRQKCWEKCYYRLLYNTKEQDTLSILKRNEKINRELKKELKSATEHNANLSCQVRTHSENTDNLNTTISDMSLKNSELMNNLLKTQKIISEKQSSLIELEEKLKQEANNSEKLEKKVKYLENLREFSLNKEPRLKDLEDRIKNQDEKQESTIKAIEGLSEYREKIHSVLRKNKQKTIETVQNLKIIKDAELKLESYHVFKPVFPDKRLSNQTQSFVNKPPTLKVQKFTETEIEKSRIVNLWTESLVFPSNLTTEKALIFHKLPRMKVFSESSQSSVSLKAQSKIKTDKMVQYSALALVVENHDIFEMLPRPKCFSFNNECTMQIDPTHKTKYDKSSQNSITGSLIIEKFSNFHKLPEIKKMIVDAQSSIGLYSMPAVVCHKASQFLSEDAEPLKIEKFYTIFKGPSSQLSIENHRTFHVRPQSSLFETKTEPMFTIEPRNMPKSQIATQFDIDLNIENVFYTNFQKEDSELQLENVFYDCFKDQKKWKSSELIDVLEIIPEPKNLKCEDQEYIHIKEQIKTEKQDKYTQEIPQNKLEIEKVQYSKSQFSSTLSSSTFEILAICPKKSNLSISTDASSLEIAPKIVLKYNKFTDSSADTTNATQIVSVFNSKISAKQRFSVQYGDELNISPKMNELSWKTQPSINISPARKSICEQFTSMELDLTKIENVQSAFISTPLSLTIESHPAMSPQIQSLQNSFVMEPQDMCGRHRTLSECILKPTSTPQEVKSQNFESPDVSQLHISELLSQESKDRSLLVEQMISFQQKEIDSLESQLREAYKFDVDHLRQSLIHFLNSLQGVPHDSKEHLYSVLKLLKISKSELSTKSVSKPRSSIWGKFLK